MALPQIFNILLMVAASILVMYWVVSQGKKLEAKQKAEGKAKGVENVVNDDIVDHVTLEHLAGLWRMISVGRNGNFAPKKVIENANLTIAIVGNTFTVTGSLEMSTVVLDNSIVPNQLDQTDASGDKHLCVVRLRDGHLEICQGEVGKPRPADFNPKRRDGASLTLFERIATVDELESQTMG